MQCQHNPASAPRPSPLPFFWGVAGDETSELQHHNGSSGSGLSPAVWNQWNGILEWLFVTFWGIMKYCTGHQSFLGNFFHSCLPSMLYDLCIRKTMVDIIVRARMAERKVARWGGYWRLQAKIGTCIIVLLAILKANSLMWNVTDLVNFTQGSTWQHQFWSHNVSLFTMTYLDLSSQTALVNFIQGSTWQHQFWSHNVSLFTMTYLNLSSQTAAESEEKESEHELEKFVKKCFNGQFEYLIKRLLFKRNHLGASHRQFLMSMNKAYSIILLLMDPEEQV